MYYWLASYQMLSFTAMSLALSLMLNPYEKDTLRNIEDFYKENKAKE